MKRLSVLFSVIVLCVFLFPSHLSAQHLSGSVPFYRYYNSQVGDHYYTTDCNRLGAGAYGWVFENVEAYIFTSAETGTVPLYQYWNAQVGDHFYTIDFNTLGYGRYGYVFENVECYVSP